MDEADVAACYEEHSAALTHFAASQVGPSDADDVLSSALLSVLQRCRQEATKIDDVRAYLYRAVANASAKHWRSADRRNARNQAFHLASQPTISASSGGPSQGDEDLNVAPMLEAMAGLTVQQRAVVHLTYWEDLTPAMIGDCLDISEGTVRSHLARARAKLREAIQ